LRLDSRVRLNNGTEMPWLGIGTYKLEPRETYRCVLEALEIGYRLVDTATYYRNEEEVGRAIRDSGLDREEVFVTTKVWNTDQGYESTLRAFQASLRRLGTDHVDLYLVHWPVPGRYIETWRALLDIYEKGAARAIGVSNFMEEHLDHLDGRWETIPAVNQVEMHPHLFPKGLLDRCRRGRIQPQAWSPLKQGKITSVPELMEIGERHRKTPAQVSLRWILQHGVSTIPRTRKREHMIENADIFDFRLDADEMERIDSMNRWERVGPDPREITT